MAVLGLHFCMGFVCGEDVHQLLVAMASLSRGAWALRCTGPSSSDTGLAALQQVKSPQISCTGKWILYD